MSLLQHIFVGGGYVLSLLCEQYWGLKAILLELKVASCEMPPVLEELEPGLLFFPSPKPNRWREAKRLHLGVSGMKKLGSVFLSS